MKKEKKFWKLFIISDLHGVYLCQKSWKVFLQILNGSKVDEVNILGDLCDFPFLSSHSQRLYQPQLLRGYTETNEIEFTKKHILYPLEEAARKGNKECKLTFQVGNHDERLTNPRSLTKEQSDRLNILYKNYNSTSIEDMLDFKKLKVDYHKGPYKDYYGVFKTTHGLSLTRNASLKNIYEYMSSGATGHTHRGNYTLINTRAGDYIWLETFCFRRRDEVEYLPTGKMADWSNGFVEVVFEQEDDGDWKFYYKPHHIREGKCYYNGKVYDGVNIKNI